MNVTTIQTPPPKDKTAEVLRLLEDGVRAVFDGDRFAAYLKTMARFHKYSPNNSLLIHLQRPDATHVAGIETWNRLGRSIVKGSKGIRILAPTQCARTVTEDLKDEHGRTQVDPATGQPMKRTLVLRARFYRVVTVFDIGQTDGRPLPEFAGELLGDPPGCDALFAAARHAATCPLELRPMKGGIKGSYSPSTHRIAIKAGMSPLMTLKTALHEIVHSRLHRAPDAGTSLEAERKTRDRIEVEAEGVTFTVLAHFGVDVSSYSFDYVASWSTDKELKELQSALSTIQRESLSLIGDMERELEGGRPIAS